MQLLQNKANISAINEHGNTPLHYACFWNFDDVAEVNRNSKLLYSDYYLCMSQGRIQEFILGGAKPRSPIESQGRSPNRGREAPEYRGRSPSRGREAHENWGRSPNRGRSPRKNGGRGLGRGLGEPLPVWGGGSVSPSPENFWKIKLETIHFGAYLKQLFEMTNEMV